MKDSEELYIFIEQFDKPNRTVLFDFVDSNAFAIFNSLLEFNYDWIMKPCMVQVINYNQKRIREGTVYRITEETLRALVNRIYLINDSFVIGFQLELNENDLPLFGNSKSFTAEEKYLLGIEENIPPLNRSLKLRQFNLTTINVRKIGQGSWNELLDRNIYKIIFDIGTIYTTSKADIQTLIGNRNKEYQISKPILILSHWDVDHYHFLLALDNDTIKSFEFFIYRGILPNLTARKVLGRFRALNHTGLLAIPPESPSPKRTSQVLKHFAFSPNREIIIYNASKNASRNKSGIGLAVRKKSTSVIFSADFDYAQISKHILPDVNYDSNHYLIVPHHGGNAGKFEYNNSRKNKLKEAIISAGKNPYTPCHPYAKNIQELSNKGFKVIRTDFISSDHLITL